MEPEVCGFVSLPVDFYLTCGNNIGSVENQLFVTDVGFESDLKRKSHREVITRLISDCPTRSLWVIWGILSVKKRIYCDRVNPKTLVERWCLNLLYECKDRKDYLNEHYVHLYNIWFLLNDHIQTPRHSLKPRKSKFSLSSVSVSVWKGSWGQWVSRSTDAQFSAHTDLLSCEPSTTADTTDNLKCVKQFSVMTVYRSCDIKPA